MMKFQMKTSPQFRLNLPTMKMNSFQLFIKKFKKFTFGSPIPNLFNYLCFKQMQ